MLAINTYLERIGAKLKFDATYVARNSFWLYAGHIASALSSLLLAMGFARFLAPATYGVYRFVHAIASTLNTVALTGMGTAVNQATAQGDDTALVKGVRYALRWNVVVLFVAGSISAYYYLQGNLELAVGMAIVALLYPPYLAYYIYASYLNGKKNFRSLAIVRIVEAFFVTVLLLGTAYFFDNALVLLSVYFGAHACFTYAMYRYFARPYIQQRQGSDKELFRYGFHSSFMNILNPVAEHIDKILVFHYLGAVELAVYSFARAIPDQIKALINFSPLMVPRFAERSLGEIKRTVWRKIAYLSLFSAGIVGVYIIAAPYIFVILFPDYQASVIYSQLYALSLLAIGSSIPSAAYTAHKKIGALYILTNSHPIVRIGLIAVLGYLYGIYGIIFAITGARFFYLILSLVLLLSSKEEAAQTARS